jgi:hypothetical protein
VVRERLLNNRPKRTAAEKRAYDKEWRQCDRAKNPEKYRLESAKCAARKSASPKWKRQAYNMRGVASRFMRAANTSFYGDPAIRRSSWIEAAYDEYERWLTSLDEADSESAQREARPHPQCAPSPAFQPLQTCLELRYERPGCAPARHVIRLRSR